MKILHFSDIHTGGHLSSAGALFDKRIIGTLNYRLRRQKHVHWEYLAKAIEVIKQEKPDVVINTGDITSVSEPSEFEEALQRLEPITKSTNFTFLNVPGNHDFYIKKRACIESRNQAYHTLNRGLFPLEEFPQKVEVNSTIFIMIDESRPNSGTVSRGHFKLKDLEKIEQWISEANGKPVILVGHYPLKDKLGMPLANRRCLENADVLVSLLEKSKIQVTLCGHIHAAFMRKESSGAIEICAGSLTIGGRLNKLEYNSESGEFTQSWIDLR